MLISTKRAAGRKIIDLTGCVDSGNNRTNIYNPMWNINSEMTRCHRAAGTITDIDMERSIPEFNTVLNALSAKLFQKEVMRINIALDRNIMPAIIKGFRRYKV